MSRYTLAEEMVNSYFDGSFAQFKTIDNLVETMVDKLQEKELNDYQKFFKAKLTDFGVKSPSQLDDEQKSEFFASIKRDWKKVKNK